MRAHTTCITCKVTDFGVSAGLQSSFAMCGTFVGTFKYMSPERMKNDKYSYSSDIWSLGLVVMECATKEYPYRVSGRGREREREKRVNEKREEA